jgi:hypothetical protein
MHAPGTVGIVPEAREEAHLVRHRRSVRRRRILVIGRAVHGHVAGIRDMAVSSIMPTRQLSDSLKAAAKPSLSTLLWSLMGGNSFAKRP